jgi:hypothetical protein
LPGIDARAGMPLAGADFQLLPVLVFHRGIVVSQAAPQADHSMEP